MSETNVYQALSERMGAGQSKLIREAWELLVTPDEGSMLLECPADAEQLAEKFDLSTDTIKEKMEELVVKGVAIPLMKEGIEKYFLPRGAGLMFESASHVSHKIVGNRLLEIWSEWLQTEHFESVRTREKRDVQGSRVFPVTGAVSDRTELKHVEDIWARVEEARRIAVVDCPCRLALQRCDHTLQNCMLFDVGADVAMRRGSGRELSKQEAHDLMKAWADEGLIAQGPNRTKMTNLCWCCGDCCLIFWPQQALGIKLCEPSRYEALVNQQTCTGCQDCVERCQFDAIEMQPLPGSKKLKAFVSADKCYGCGVCVVGCPSDSIAFNLVRSEDHLPV